MGLRDKLRNAANTAVNTATSAATTVTATAATSAAAAVAGGSSGGDAPAGDPAPPAPVLPQLQDGPVHSDTGALEPVAGITLERYAELAAKMAGCDNDLERCAQVAEAEGVDRATWRAAMDGWNARMHDPATAGEVALAYMPLYQDALSRFGGPRTTATEDEYLEMLAMINTDLKEGDVRPVPFEPMYARFGIDAPKWSQISTDWVETLNRDPERGGAFGDRFVARIKELDELWLTTHTLPWST